MRRSSLISLALLCCPALAPAQTPAAIHQAMASITPADVVRRIGIIADDSMLGRATPSPQIEQVARYIAGEFKKFGLKPLGDSGTFIQHYPILRQQIDTAISAITITGHSAAPFVLKLGSTVNYVLGDLPTRDLTGPLTVLAGTPDSANPLGGANVRGKWVGQIVGAGPQGITVSTEFFTEALKGGALGILFISNRPDAQWENRLERLQHPSLTLGGLPPDPTNGPLVEIRDVSAKAATGLDASVLRNDGPPS
ncbi:MAG TPA: hypothetical protein VGI83_03990, partial [Gemmatimonadales bacterium]